MKTILVATHGTTLTIAGFTAMFGTPSDGFIGKASNVGMELRPEHIELVVSDMAEIMASPEYKLWAHPEVKPAPKARPSPISSTSSTSPPKAKPTPKAKTSGSKPAASTSSTFPSGAAKPSRTRKRTRKPSTASPESSVNGAEANAGAPPHSLTMADQEKAVLEAGGSLSETETPGPRPVKTRVRHRKPPKPRPVVVEEPEAVNS